ncbi:MAG: RdgB/HAM1 family non-canonical purine NTP pyrophosphatase [Bacilli bacterium]|jgi:XTP/dITP diphosphohydrolase|nr:RdgB/HAM1 family non-canonical purine NTP pyrophosphatase [Bacilli bacterium]
MDKKEVVIATTNQGKLKEFKRMLEPLGFKVSSLADEKVEIDVEETGKTFEENSLIKACCIHAKLPNKIIIADDSGLEVHALGGFPGIYSARFMEGQPYPLKRQAIIDRLKDKEDRSANFTSAISLIGFDEEEHVFVGKTFGFIANESSGDSGFGYDPIFFSPDLQKTFGQASPEEKDSVSHRGRALKQLEEYIKAHLD